MEQGLGGCDVIYRGTGRLALLRFTPRQWCWANCFPHPILGDPTPYQPDGTVNIDDLLTVINRWGDTGSGIWGDTTDDGTVGIDDLLMVIMNWGPCTNPSPEDFPASLWACYNQYCAGLTGEDFQNCYNRSAQAVCSQNPEECE